MTEQFKTKEFLLIVIIAFSLLFIIANIQRIAIQYYPFSTLILLLFSISCTILIMVAIAAIHYIKKLDTKKVLDFELTIITVLTITLFLIILHDRSYMAMNECIKQYGEQYCTSLIAGIN